MLSSLKKIPRSGVLIIGVLVALWLCPRVIPYSGQGTLDTLGFSPVILDGKGGTLQVLPVANGLRRTFEPLEKMPRELLEVVLSAEDRRFWLHPGFDPLSLARALFQNTSQGSTVSGASTITMQLARLINPRARTNTNKLFEIWEAIQLESRLGKKGVLELYLNLVPFGQNIEGFPAAAQVFWGKPLGELTRAEMLILAVIPRSPGIYNPFQNKEKNREAVTRMIPQEGYLPQEINEALIRVLDPGRSGIWPFRTPHFVRWLSGTQDFQAHDTRLPFKTTIDPGMQKSLEQLLLQTVNDARAKRISNSAALFVRPQTMEIAAWVGSIDFHDDTNDGQIDGVTMTRQPGSTLKPLLYSLALTKGWTASMILPDIPTDFGGNEVYTPANFNDQYNGPVRLRQALAASLNIPAVYTLQRLGVLSFTDLLIKAGFRSLEAQRGQLGLGLALGNAEVSLFELVQSFGIFLHEGRLVNLRANTKAIDSDNNPDQVLDPRVSLLIRDIMTRHPDRTLTFGHRGATSRLKYDVAIKTGTSNQFNNIWATGFTPDLLGGVWMGNFQGQTVVGTADSGYPAGILAKMLETFSAHTAFPSMEGFERHRICSLSGELATQGCPHGLMEWFLPGTAPVPCTWHSPTGAELRIPQEYQTWLSRYRYKGPDSYLDSEVAILRPLDKALFYMDPSYQSSAQQMPIEATGTGQAVVTVDGRKIYEGRFPVRIFHPLEKGAHTLEVQGDNGSDRIGFEVK